MKVAKEQALIREKAASFTKVGKAVPEMHLIQKYNRTLDQRLKHFRPRDVEDDEDDSQYDSMEGSLLNDVSVYDAENVNPVSNIMGNKTKVEKLSQVPQAAEPARSPPPPPWGAIAPRGISLNGLPVGTAVPLATPSYMPVWNGACGSGANSYIPPSSPSPSYVPSPSMMTRSPSPGMALQPTPQSIRELPSVTLPPSSPLLARSGIPVPRTWSGTNMPPCNTMETQHSVGSMPVAVPTSFNGGFATPTAVATAICASPSVPVPVVVARIASAARITSATTGVTFQQGDVALRPNREISVDSAAALVRL